MIDKRGKKTRTDMVLQRSTNDLQAETGSHLFSMCVHKSFSVLRSLRFMREGNG